MLGVNAFGLCGLDGKLMQATRKESVQSIENGKRKIIRDDYTGKIETVNSELLTMLLNVKKAGTNTAAQAPTRAIVPNADRKRSNSCIA